MDASQRVVHAGKVNGGRGRKAQARALVLLGVGEARVDGQDQRRVSGGVKGAGLNGGAHQALAGGVPRLLRRHLRGAKAGALKARAVLDQAVSGEGKLISILLGSPGLDAGVSLHDGLRGEGAVGAGLVQLVDAGVDLAAHGVSGHGELAADAGLVGGPGHGVERRGSVERTSQAAGKALCRGNANTHAREGAGAASHQNRVHVRHAKASVCQRALAGAHELHVCLAAAEVVGGGQNLHGAICHARDGAGQHVR